MTRSWQVAQRLRSMCCNVETDPPSIGVLSSGERCAVALILNDPEHLDSGDTMLYAAQRLDPGWLEICWEIQRDGWREP